jgi:hypothetical protein
MKFSVKINGAPAGELEADNACDAVDAFRASHAAPDEGGDFEVEISSAESWKDSAGKDRPAGVVSSFSMRHEPAEHMREAVEAAAREKAEAEAKAADRERIRAEVRAEMAAEAAAKAVTK